MNTETLSIIRKWSVTHGLSAVKWVFSENSAQITKLYRKPAMITSLDIFFFTFSKFSTCEFLFILFFYVLYQVQVHVYRASIKLCLQSHGNGQANAVTKTCVGTSTLFRKVCTMTVHRVSKF